MKEKLKYKFKYKFDNANINEFPYYSLLIESRNNMDVLRDIFKKYTLTFRSSKFEIKTIVSTSSKHELKIIIDLLGLRLIKPFAIISTDFGSFIRGYYRKEK